METLLNAEKSQGQYINSDTKLTKDDAAFLSAFLSNMHIWVPVYITEKASLISSLRNMIRLWLQRDVCLHHKHGMEAIQKQIARQLYDIQTTVNTQKIKKKTILAEFL